MNILKPSNPLPDIEIGRNPPRYPSRHSPALIGAILVGGVAVICASLFFLGDFSANSPAMRAPPTTTGQGQFPAVDRNVPAEIIAPAPEEK